MRETREANLIVEPFAYLEMARVADALGHEADARTYYERFLWRYDAAPASHRQLIEEAQASIVRLDGRLGTDRSR